jgi:anti-anti-sigma factor
MTIEIRMAKEGEVPLVSVTGRLDGFGSRQMEESLKEIVRDDTRSVILNLAGVDYLSSAGIRVLLGLKKKLKQRNGTLALVNVQEFPKNVLEMAGFLKVFDIYSSLREAEIACLDSPDHHELLKVHNRQAYNVEGTMYEVEQGSTRPASLIVTGSLEKVLESAVSSDDVRALGFSEAEYSLGLGALGKDLASAMPLLGEMITLHGSMVYVPTDGHCTPDFFSPAKETGEVKIFTGYNIALSGAFHEIVTFESDWEEGISLAGLYKTLFSFAKGRRPDFRGILCVVLWGVVEGVISSEITRSPVLKNAPKNHKSIMDPENYQEWNETNLEPRYRGDTLVSFGIGIDLASDLSAFQPGDIRALCYVHPGNQATSTMYLHNHGVIFRGFLYNPEADLQKQLKAIVRDGEFLDMRHLMDETRIAKAKCGVSYITLIEQR